MKDNIGQRRLLLQGDINGVDGNEMVVPPAVDPVASSRGSRRWFGKVRSIRRRDEQVIRELFWLGVVAEPADDQAYHEQRYGQDHGGDAQQGKAL
jgi:hypothetical protein